MSSNTKGWGVCFKEGKSLQWIGVPYAKTVHEAVEAARRFVPERLREKRWQPYGVSRGTIGCDVVLTKD